MYTACTNLSIILYACGVCPLSFSVSLMHAHTHIYTEQVKTSLPGIKALVSGMTSRSPSKPKKGEYEPEVELDVMSGEKLTPVEEKDTKKPPSKDSPLRWVFLAVLWVVLILL